MVTLKTRAQQLIVKARSHIETELNYPVLRPEDGIVSDSPVLTKTAGPVTYRDWTVFISLI